MSLLTNASKFSEQENVYLTLDLGSWQPNHTLLLSVKDHGIEIENNKLKTIFNPFVEVDGSDTRRYSGAGLGIAISQRVCHLMNGDIWVESKLGEGTTFTVQLPFK